MSPQPTESVKWTCGECNRVEKFKPDYDGDMPDGWFRVEDEACFYVCCSLACLHSLVSKLEEPAARPSGGDTPT